LKYRRRDGGVKTPTTLTERHRLEGEDDDDDAELKS
jgi:hypothetical protein